ncbi:hypothetical protein FLM55_02455 [Francisella sp. Scap27]|uniref:hypothetical protein n=1 Tax=Francisella sp. Scap27 TaxID=2589986 RepID=UPI0015B87A96|nr:hypothetical protein [Francisella sp. Scap27]QLE78664.1 hypothetical protein FLM55_02455 [Francisella sp. Scap27]
MLQKNIVLLLVCFILASCTPPSSRAQALRDKAFKRKGFNTERYKKFKHAHDIDNVDYDIGPYHTYMIKD